MTIRPAIYVRVYFVLVLLIGLLVFRDYGVSWDESIDRVNGLVNAKYITDTFAPEWTANQAVFANVPEFATHQENDHGALFHLPLAFMEVAFPGLDSRTYYFVRHFCIFLTFVLGLWSMYRIGRLRFGSWQAGLGASTLLLLSPRIFAHAFFNGKDLVFLGLFTFGIYTLVRLLERPTLARAALHGLATALATDVRILGCLLLALSLGMVVVEIGFGSPEGGRRRQLGKAAAVYCVVAALLTVVGWPYLWDAPAANFLLAFENMKRFRWGGALLYRGEAIMALVLPWHYALTWIAITTPVAYCLAHVAGLASYTYALLRHGLATLRTTAGRLDLLFCGWFIVPLFMVMALNSVIYDDWRHLYFIYPAFLLLAVRGALSLWQASRRSAALRVVAVAAAVLAGAEAVFTAARMVEAHPNEQVYFSFLTPNQAERLFERDYWGVSFRQGLEWILAYDQSPQIYIDAPFSILLENNLAILKPADRARFKISGTAKNRYFLTGYRTHPEAYPDSVGSEVHAIKANGIKILSVFQRW